MHLAVNALRKSLEQISPACCKLLTSQTLTHPTFENIQVVKIPHIDSLEAYSRFMIRELHKYVDTSHALVIQADGYVLNGSAWSDFYLTHDYIGSPFNPSGTVGNGGFSLRSQVLFRECLKLPTGSDHPEDAAISLVHRNQLEKGGVHFALPALASTFAFEGRSWRGKEWGGLGTHWNGQFGFHSLLTVLPPDKKPCKIFHHSGDAGDVIYSLPAMAALGGGALFLSADCKYPYPLPPRWTRTGGEASFVDNLRPLLEAQPYVDRCSYTHGTPFSTDYDLNKFREPWKNRTALDTESIFALHQRAFGTQWPEDSPWLTAPDPIVSDRPIVVNRTARYRNEDCNWWALVQKYGHLMRFVGTPQEAEVFEGFATPKPLVPWYQAKDMLELARVIAGAKVFIGNQSSPLAIAHGLGKNVIVEEWPLNPNCRLHRPGAIYWKGGLMDIPESWLK